MKKKKKKNRRKLLLSQVWLKNEFVTSVAFNIELHSRKINALEHQ